MTTAALNNLWTYLQGLNLSARDRNWLSEQLSTLSRQADSPKQVYDPETGEYLNDETVKAIEDARRGKDIAFSGTLEEFHQWAEKQ